MADTIPDDLKAAYAAETKAEKGWGKEKAKDVKLTEKAALQAVDTNEAKVLYIDARSERRRLEREYEIGEWAPSGVPPTLVGRVADEV